jgi:predicted DNA-binding transcriptional regulator AlpA
MARASLLTDDASVMPIRASDTAPSPADDRLLDAREVGAMLGVPATWVHTQSREGRLPTVHLGRYKRYRRSAIAAYIAEHENTASREGSRPVPDVRARDAMGVAELEDQLLDGAEGASHKAVRRTST